MKKKLMLPLIVAALGLSACSSEPAAAPLEAEPLHNLLIDGSESGLDNATEGNDTSLSGQPINLTVVNGALDIDGSCGKALQAVEDVNLDSVASASRALASGDKQVGIAMYSTAEDNDISQWTSTQTSRMLAKTPSSILPTPPTPSANSMMLPTAPWDSPSTLKSPLTINALP